MENSLDIGSSEFAGGRVNQPASLLMRSTNGMK